MDPAQYGERQPCASSFVTITSRTVPRFRRTIAENKGLNIPVEITRWLGRKSFEEGDFQPQSSISFPSSRNQRILIRRS